jgi:hypothetical protein
MAPNSAAPITKLTAAATLKVRMRNSRNGMAGSAARRSTTTKAAPSTTVAAPRPRITGEPQAYCVPPQVVSSTRQVMAEASSAVPGQSMRTSRRAPVRGSTALVTNRATMPRGRLT